MRKIYSAFFPGAFPPKCRNDHSPKFFNRFSAARSIHHNAVMLAETMLREPQQQKSSRWATIPAT
jgi:hypothetical protein